MILTNELDISSSNDTDESEFIITNADYVCINHILKYKPITSRFL